MLKGIQHPLKAIIMRSFLLKKLKERNYERDDSSVIESSVQFYINNLEYMARFWSRLQFIGFNSSETLRLLPSVTENLQLIASFHLEISFYQESVLPVLLGQVRKLKDKTIQKVLVKSIISSFREMYHLYTLTQLLDLCVFISESEGSSDDIWTINVLLSKLTSYYATADKERKEELNRIDKQVEVLPLFKKALIQILEDQGMTGSIKKLIELVFDFIASAMLGFDNTIPTIDEIFQATKTLIFDRREDKDVPHQSQRKVEEVLLKVIKNLADRLFVFDHFIGILSFANIYVRRALSKEMVKVL